MNAATKPFARERRRGVALITTLCLLALLSAASLAMVLLVSSDTMINGYYGNYRSSFYAADSGVNVVVGAMKTAIFASANPAANPPLSAAVPASVVAAYAQFQGGFTVVSDPNSWHEQFKLLPNVDGAPVLGAPTVTTQGTDPNNLLWTFTYPYKVTVQGQSTNNNNEGEIITETGTISFSSSPGSGAAAGLPSFSRWGAFINKFDACQGALVPGTMTGPFFTNGQWNFGNSNSPGYTFTDTVGQANADVSWFTNRGCQNSPTAPRGFKEPTFDAGLQLNQDPVTPPSDSYNQVQAVLDGKGLPPCTVAPCAPAPPPSQTQMSQVLKTIAGTSYPSSGSAPNGVYIPWYTDSSGAAHYGSDQSGTPAPAGGFYVQGDASVTLSATTDGANNPTQTYTINQSGVVTTIVVDNATGTTSVSSGGNSQTLQGVPTQVDPTSGSVMTQNDPGSTPGSTGAPVDPTLVYVNGEITGISGTVQDGNGITVTAADDVNITGDLTYASSPVSIPSDTLNGGTDAGVLGIYTTGNINLNPNSSGPNRGDLTVDASLAAIGGGDSGFETRGRSIDNWTIVGGRSEDAAHGVNINSGNTYYDRRFAGNFGPPWFPTAVPQPGAAGAQPIGPQTSVRRTSWVETSRQ